jgi:transcriptional regulator with XRE-family HTH domain
MYSNDSAAAALEERGVTVSGVHLSHLRSGRRDNPSARLLAALAELFGVPYSYFFDSATEAKINAELDDLAAIRNSRAKSIMLRAQAVSPKNLEFLETTLEHLLEIEGLDKNGEKVKK